jgi:hypothetical protein
MALQLRLSSAATLIDADDLHECSCSLEQLGKRLVADLSVIYICQSWEERYLIILPFGRQSTPVSLCL